MVIYVDVLMIQYRLQVATVYQFWLILFFEYFNNI
jgi:hypothetical protein